MARNKKVAEIDVRHSICLRTENDRDRIALRGVRLRTSICGMTQKTTLEQTFINQEDRAIEAVYTFPLPDDGAVCKFEVVTGDHVLTGAIDEREKAIEQYDDAMREGHGGFLLEQDRPDIFSVRVGNLKPKQAATIRLTCISELEVVDQQVRVRFPTTVAPRYITATGSDPMRMMVDADAINPPHVLHVPYGVSMEVDIDLGRPLKAFSSPSHKVKFEHVEGARYRATFVGGVAEMDRDIVLNLELAAEQQPCVQVGTGPDQAQYLAVTFLPEFDGEELAAPEPAEVVFVIDCSGSMAGESIEQAKKALELCLRSVNLGDSFNICRFGSTFELMSPEPLVYSPKTLEQALAYVHQIDADLGGTELHAPLAAVLKPRPVKGAARQVIVLTDGEVSNEEAVFTLARQMKGRNRIFSFGIGASPSANLVNGLARASGGAAEFITPGEDIADKVLRTFSRIASPDLSGVEIDWGGDVSAAPAELPPIFAGDALTVFGRVSGKSLPTRVTLQAKTKGGPKKWSVDVAPAGGDGDVLATGWARRRIVGLEEEAQRNAKELVALSRQFGLLCSLTAFIAIEHRSIEERNEGRPELRRIPTMLAAGWGGIDMCLAAPAAGAAASYCMDLSMDACDVASAAPPRIMRSIARKLGSFASRACAGPVPASPSAVQLLLSLQSAEGWFDWLPSAENMLAGSDRKNVQAALPALCGSIAPADAAHVEQTALMLVLLQRNHADEEPLWRRAWKKAIRWLATISGKSAKDVEAWLRPLT